MIHLSKRGRRLFFPLLGLLLISETSTAGCVFGGEEKVDMYLNPETQFWGDFVGRQELYTSFVGKCNEDAGKYLMISMGVSQASQDSSVRDTFIFDTYKPALCQFKDAMSMKAMEPARQAEQFSQQFRILRSCFDIKVNDLANHPLQYKASQENCQIIPMNDGGVLLRGDMCFIKIGARNQYAITPVLKNECLQPDFLKNKGLMPQDLQANLNILVAGDDSGLSQDLTHIGLRPIRVSIVPKSKSIALTDDYGKESPRFVTTYSADVDWGGLHIYPAEERTKIDLSLLASNFSEKSCAGDYCTRASNYLQPLFGQVEIYEMNPGRRPQLKEEWWDGGFAAPNWQGFITGMGFTSNENIFVPGRKYHIRMTFQDPTDDYAIFLSGLTQMLVNLSSMEGSTVGIDVLPAIGSLQQLGVFPSLPGAGSLRSNNQPVNLTAISKGLSDIVANRIWPAYYSKICDSSTSSCLSLGKQKFYQRLSLEFVAGGIDPESGELIIKNLATQKESKIFQSYPMAQRPFPTITCGDK